MPPPDLPPAEAFARFRRQDNALTWAVRALVVALVAVFLIYAIVFARTITDMYQPERFQEPLAAAVDELGPEVGDAVLTAVQSARPAYVEEARRRWEQAGPLLQKRVEAEFTGLATDLGQDLRSGAVDLLKASLEERGERIDAMLGGISDPAVQQRLRDRLIERLGSGATNLAEAAYNANQHAVDGLLVRLAEVDTDNEFRRLDKADLVRRYLSLWLQWIDHHLLYEHMEGFLP